MSVNVTTEEPRLDDLCDLRTETRSQIAAGAVALVDRVLAHSIDPDARRLAAELREHLAVEHAVCAAIRALVG